MVYVARIYQYMKNQKGNDVMLIETKDLSTELVGSDEKLLTGLRSHLYQMVVLHHLPKKKDLFCQRYLDEQLYITLFPALSYSLSDVKNPPICS